MSIRKEDGGRDQKRRSDVHETKFCDGAYHGETSVALVLDDVEVGGVRDQTGAEKQVHEQNESNEERNP